MNNRPLFLSREIEDDKSRVDAGRSLYFLNEISDNAFNLSQLLSIFLGILQIQLTVEENIAILGGIVKKRAVVVEEARVLWIQRFFSFL